MYHIRLRDGVEVGTIVGSIKGFNIPEGELLESFDNEQSYLNRLTALREPSIEEYKLMRIDEMTLICQSVIVDGFVASNGNEYRLQIEDQLNMQGQKDELDSDPDIQAVYWRTMNSGYIEHSIEEWMSVFREAFQHKKECLFKLDSLRNRVLNASTVEEIESIQW